MPENEKPRFICNKCGYCGANKLHDKPGFFPSVQCTYEAAEVPRLTKEDAERAVIAAADEFYDLAHSDNVNFSDWKAITGKIDKAVQNLRKLRAVARATGPVTPTTPTHRDARLADEDRKAP